MIAMSNDCLILKALLKHLLNNIFNVNRYSNNLQNHICKKIEKLYKSCDTKIIIAQIL